MPWALGAGMTSTMSAGGRPGTTVTFGHGLAVVNVNVNGAYVPYTRRREARAQPRARSQSVTIGGSAGRPLSRVGDMARLDALTPQEGIPHYRPATDDYQ